MTWRILSDCQIENLNGVEVLTLFDVGKRGAGRGIISNQQPPERKNNFGR